MVLSKPGAAPYDTMLGDLQALNISKAYWVSSMLCSYSAQNRYSLPCRVTTGSGWNTDLASSWHFQMSIIISAGHWIPLNFKLGMTIAIFSILSGLKWVLSTLGVCARWIILHCVSPSHLFKTYVLLTLLKAGTLKIEFWFLVKGRPELFQAIESLSSLLLQHITTVKVDLKAVRSPAESPNLLYACFSVAYLCSTVKSICLCWDWKVAQ